MINYLIPSLVAGPVLIGLLALFLPKKVQWWLFLLVNIAILAAVFKLAGHWGQSFSHTIKYISFNGQGLKLGMSLTHLGWFFLAITSVSTLLFSMFSVGFNDKKHITRVAPLWLMLIGASNGIFLSSDWLMFFIVWELMSWTSLLIIGHGKILSFKAGIFYYTLSMAGTVAMLAGIWMLFYMGGTLDINASVKTLVHALMVKKSIGYLVTLLFALGFFSKSAIFPFHMWPSMAHAEAPDDFSSYLSGIMIKYGIYGLLLFLVPAFMMTPNGTMKTIMGVSWPMYVMAVISAITAVVGTLLAIFSSDMKRLMAYSTVANVGYIGAALATGSAVGYAAAMFHTATHMVFKGAIFTSLAAVKFRTGEREMHKLGGLGYVMPITFLTFLLGIIAAAGIPPLSGFNSKWLIFQALFQKKMVFIATAMFFASTGAFLYLFRALHTIFLGQLSPRFKKVREVGPLMSGSMILMMGLMMAVGVAPGLITKPIASVITSMGMVAPKFSMFTMVGTTTTINTQAIALAFGFAVILVFILYLLGAKRRKVEGMDNYTCGEIPEDWGTTPERYHYGHSFYLPIRKLFTWIPLGAVERAYNGFARFLHRVGAMFEMMFNESSSLGWSFALGLIAILVLGVSL